MIFVRKLGLHEGRRSPVTTWLRLWFSSICYGEISQSFHSLWKLSYRSLKKPKKIGVIQAVSSLFEILCFLPLFQIWSYELFLSTGTRKGTNMFDGPANLRKFHRRKREKSHLKDPCFLCRKTLDNGIELRQDRYLSMRRLSNLSSFENLSRGVIFRFTSISGVEGLWILRVYLLENLHFIT